MDSRWSGRLRRALGLTLALSATVCGVACAPKTIAEAEKRGDVAWLDAKATPESIAALGRLADTNPKAAQALERRAGFDPAAYTAAWEAMKRGAAWGTALFKTALGDPTRAETAASTLPRGDTQLSLLLPDLEGALVRLGASTHNAAVSTAIASAGQPAHDIVMRRLADAATRGAMCRGVGSTQASADARKSLMQGPAQSRDNPYCLDACLKIAADDDEALAWMSSVAEPGLLGAAGKSDLLTCARLHVAWSKALATRPPAEHPALVVPLASALKRCPVEMDGVLADAIRNNAAVDAVVVGAIDPYGSYGLNLKATCTALPAVLQHHATSPLVRERAGDALAHSCKMK